MLGFFYFEVICNGVMLFWKNRKIIKDIDIFFYFFKIILKDKIYYFEKKNRKVIKDIDIFLKFFKIIKVKFIIIMKFLVCLEFFIFVLKLTFVFFWIRRDLIFVFL